MTCENAPQYAEYVMFIYQSYTKFYTRNQNFVLRKYIYKIFAEIYIISNTFTP